MHYSKDYGNVILIKNTYMDCQITDMKVTKQRRLDLIVEYFDYCSVHVSTVISHSALWFSSSSHNGLCQCSGTISMNLNIFL
ncbi:hypothetical protein T08_697 [Trichinella sp. T8]|nr:hypothetical protein T08_697 [Trichinella sp. T8]